MSGHRTETVTDQGPNESNSLATGRPSNYRDVSNGTIKSSMYVTNNGNCNDPRPILSNLSYELRMKSQAKALTLVTHSNRCTAT